MLKLRPNIHSLLRPVTCNLGQSLCASNSSIWASDKKKQTNYLLWARNFHSSPSVSSIVKSRFESVPLSQKDVFSFVWENVSKYGHRTAMVDGITGRSLTYAESYNQSLAFGLSLRDAGSQKGDVLALLLPNSIEYAIAFTGAPAVGVTLTTMNPIYTPTEIVKQLAISNTKWVVTNKELFPKIKEALEKMGGAESWKGRVIIAGEPVPDQLSMTDMLSHPDSGSDPSGLDLPSVDVHNDVVVLPFSSGTTGVPKGVMLTHFNIVSNICQSVKGPWEISLVQEKEDSDQEVTLCVLPLYHIYAMNVTMLPFLHTGSKVVFMPKFESTSFINALRKYKPTILHMAPPLVSFMVANHEVTSDLLKNLNQICVAAAPSGPELIKKFKEKAPNLVYREGWGMSETSPIALMTSLDDEVNGSCGVLVPNTEAKVIDVGSGKTLGSNQRGELCIRGPQVMKGYLNNPAATAETLKDDWLYSGDVALINDKGHFFIVDRLKELIKVKGFQVPPAELEDLLRGLKAVQDVAVIGIPHEKFGEAPRAYIVKAEGNDGDSLTEDKVLSFVAENAASYKQLVGGIEFVEAIPKSAAGKILRKELVAKYKASIN